MFIFYRHRFNFNQLIQILIINMHTVEFETLGDHPLNDDNTIYTVIRLVIITSFQQFISQILCVTHPFHRMA